MTVREYSGFKEIDLVIPAGLQPSEAVELEAGEVVWTVMAPSDWVSSGIQPLLTFDSGVTFKEQWETTAIRANLFEPLAASRSFLPSFGKVGYAHLRHFKLKSWVDQVTDKTIGLTVLTNSISRGTDPGYRYLSVTVPANDLSDTIQLARGEGVAAIYYPVGWTTANVYWYISGDSGVTFEPLYSTSSTQQPFHTNAAADTCDTNLFSYAGQADRYLKVKPTVAQSGPQTIIMLIIDWHVMFSSRTQSLTPLYHPYPTGVIDTVTARGDRHVKSGGTA